MYSGYRIAIRYSLYDCCRDTWADKESPNVDVTQNNDKWTSAPCTAVQRSPVSSRDWWNSVIIMSVVQIH